MKEITTYKVYNRVFSDKRLALKYQRELSQKLNFRAENLILYWYNMLGYPGISEAEDLVCNFTNNRRFLFGKYQGACIGKIAIIDRKYITWLLDSTNFRLTPAERALYEINKPIRIDTQYDRDLVEFERELLNNRINR